MAFISMSLLYGGTESSRLIEITFECVQICVTVVRPCACASRVATHGSDVSAQRTADDCAPIKCTFDA